MRFFNSKDRASARASARVSARVNARNKEAAASLKSASMQSSSRVADAVKSSPKRSILLPPAARGSHSGGSPAGKLGKSVVIDSAAFQTYSADSAAVTDSASYSVSSLGRKNLNQYNGDEIADSLRAMHKIIEEANAVIQAYAEAPPPIVPNMVNVSSTKAASSVKGKGGPYSLRSKNAKGPTPEEEAVEAARVAATAAAAARESLRRRTTNVTGKTREQVFVWATQSLMRELDLVMPIFLDKKYHVKVETMTMDEAETLAENTEVETLMPVTSSFLRKIDKSVDAIIEREEREKELSRAVNLEGKDDCGVLEAFQNFGGGSEQKEKELTPAQKKLAKEIEDDDRSVIVLAADMAEELIQSLAARENEPMSGEAIYTRDVSLLAAK
jgi:hypothetical protein